MGWVRGHYRRNRRPSAGDVGCLLLVVLGVLFAGLVVALAEAFDRVQKNPGLVRAIATALVVCAVGFVAVIVWRFKQGQGLRRFLERARRIAATAEPHAADVRELRDLRPRRLTTAALAELEALYRGAVHEVVSDYAVSKGERRRLDHLVQAFDLPNEISHRAAVDGFLQAHAVLVGDGRLTEKEQDQLAELQKVLRVPDAGIQAQLVYSDELVRARLVLSSEPVAIQPDVKLKASEACFYATPFVEKKERVGRTYVQDGVRHKEMTLEVVRDGRLFVTNERVLLVASGTTSLKYEKILESAVDAESRLLSLTVDGRKAPYLFEVPEPFVAIAYVDKLARRP